MATLKSAVLDDPTRVPSGTYGTVSFAWVEFDIPSGTAVDDVINFLELPTGARVIDSFWTTDGSPGNTADMRLGLKAVDANADSADKEDDDDFFNGDKDLDSAATYRRDTQTGFPRLKTAHYVQGTIKAASVDANTKVYVGVYYAYEGTE